VKRVADRIPLVSILMTFVLAAGCTTTQSPRQQVQDSRITAQVKAKIAADVNLSTLTNVKIDSTNGVVTLSGEVENEGVKNRAAEIARSAEGVVSVNNNLQVESATGAARGVSEPTDTSTRR
jgi:osmotically-inducible protein OsmY